ncbi:NYN domain-containing protein [Oxalobacteraceae bacterium A2-2]
MPQSSPHRTAVYIDGCNLYYSRLRHSQYKWLDVAGLFDAILAQRDQNEILCKLKFFTAPVLANFSTHGVASETAQSAYHRALYALHQHRVEVINGKHSYDRSGSLMPLFVDGARYDRGLRVRVWKLEEKKTDVNLALHMYRDVAKGRYDRIVLVSNDSDAEPALAAVREDFPGVVIGLVSPVRPPEAGEKAKRRLSGSLAKYADWIVPYLSDEQLLAAQLPSLVLTRKKPIVKPRHWFEDS